MLARRILAATVFFCGVVVAHAQTAVPHEFQSGTPARASEVNENFDTLEQAVDDNAAAIEQIQGLSGLSREAAQIQTGLNLASGLRWLVKDYYSTFSRLPGDNSDVGAVPGHEWVNRFVSYAHVLQNGTIQIQFGVDAAPQIANQLVFLTPIDPGSGVLWFDCSGDGVTDVFVAELDCAFSDPPLEPLYSIRQQVLTAFDLLQQSDAIKAVQDYTWQNLAFPQDNAAAALADPFGYRNKYVDSMEVRSGLIRITFGRDAAEDILDMPLDFSPFTHAGSIEWNCRSTQILDKYLPVHCR